ncbi:MAG: DUF4836 family protein, partial [Prevotella sp.]
MKKTFFGFPLVLVMMVLMMTSCSDNAGYVNMIPDDTFCVLKIDVKQIADKINENGNVFSGKLEQMLAGEDCTPEVREKLKAILNDPAEIGIDFRQPILVCLSLKNGATRPMILAIVHDADKITELLKVTKIEDKDIKSLNGMTYACHQGAIVAYNDDVLCVKSVEDADEAATAAEVAKLLGGETKYSFGESEFGKKLFATEGLMQCLITGEVYSLMGQYMPEKPIFPKGVDMKDFAGIINITADKGKATMQYEYVLKSDELKAYIEKVKDAVKPIDDKFLNYISDKGLVLLANIDGEKYKELIKENAVQFSDQAEVMQMLDFLSIIKGNFALGLNGFSTYTIPNLSVYSETTNSLLADLVKSMLGDKANVGYKDGVSYVLMGGNKPFEKVNNSIHKGKMKDMCFYGHIDFQMIVSLMAMKNRNDMIGSMQAFTQYVKSIEMSVDKDLRFEMVLNMQDESKNPLAAIAEILAN